jgi:hypothetical protein
VLDAIAPLERAGLVDEVLVVDAAPATARRGSRASTRRRVSTSRQLMPGYGPALGKGDAMWRGRSRDHRRASSASSTPDTEDFHAGFVTRPARPLLTRPEPRSSRDLPAPAARRRHRRSPTAAGASPSSSPGRT